MILLIAVLLLMAVATLILVRSVVSGSASTPTPSYAGKVRTSVQRCMKMVSEDALLQVGWQGGLHGPDTQMVQTPLGKVSYLPYGTNISKRGLAEYLAKYIDEHLFGCVRNLSEYMPASLERPHTEVEIGKNSIWMTSNLPISITHDGTVEHYDRFRISSEVPVMTLLDTMSSIISSERRFSLEDVKGVSTEVFMLDEGRQLVVLSAKNSMIRNRPYYLIFATDWREP